MMLLASFFNPNIHPYQEYQKRLDALKQYSEKVGLKVIYRDEYLLEEFLRNVSHRVKERCQFCYSIRLEATAREARNRVSIDFRPPFFKAPIKIMLRSRKPGSASPKR